MAAGFRSPLATWVGGAAAPAPAGAGFRSMLAFWLGGACASPGVSPPIPPTPSGGGLVQFARPVRKTDEDEVLLLIAAQIAIGLI